MRARLCAAILIFEAVVLGLSTPVLISVADIPTTVALAVGLGLVLACLVLAALSRLPVALLGGWAVQIVTLAMGIEVGTMILLGLVFGGLYATAWVLGGRIDRGEVRPVGRR